MLIWTRIVRWFRGNTPLSLLVVIACAVFLVWLIARLIMRRGDRSLRDARSTTRCPHCRYNLKALRAKACPECGFDLESGGVLRPGMPQRGLLTNRIAVLTFIVLALASLTWNGLERRKYTGHIGSKMTFETTSGNGEFRVWSEGELLGWPWHRLADMPLTRVFIAFNAEDEAGHLVSLKPSTLQTVPNPAAFRYEHGDWAPANVSEILNAESIRAWLGRHDDGRAFEIPDAVISDVLRIASDLTQRRSHADVDYAVDGEKLLPDLDRGYRHVALLAHFGGARQPRGWPSAVVVVMAIILWWLGVRWQKRQWLRLSVSPWSPDSPQ